MAASTKVSRRQVVSVILDMLEAGKPVSGLARSLAAYLVETKQSRNVELYIRDIELMAAERFGVATVYVESARKLSDKAKMQIEKLVKNSSQAKTVEMVEKVEPSLIGGVIVKTADAELDGSIRTKIRNLRSI